MNIKQRKFTIANWAITFYLPFISFFVWKQFHKLIIHSVNKLPYFKSAFTLQSCKKTSVSN